MMYKEFTEISKMEIGYENYTNVIEPMYNAMENMDKFEFVEFIKPSARKMAKEYKAQKDAETVANQKAVFISDGLITPNGCWYVGRWAKLVDVDVNIRKGANVYTLREMTEEERRDWSQTHDMTFSSSYDIGTWEDVNWKK